jgi:hypothetical protein
MHLYFASASQNACLVLCMCVCVCARTGMHDLRSHTPREYRHVFCKQRRKEQAHTHKKISGTHAKPQKKKTRRCTHELGTRTENIHTHGQNTYIQIDKYLARTHSTLSFGTHAPPRAHKNINTFVIRAPGRWMSTPAPCTQRARPNRLCLNAHKTD